MGKERERKGERLFLYIACLLTTVALCAGCVTAVNSQKQQGNRHIEQAERLVKNGDYSGALKEYEAASVVSSGVSPGDRALFHMGLIWARPENPDRDYGKGLECFELLVRDFPDSSLADDALAWTGIINELISRESRIRDLEDTLSSLNVELAAVKETYTGSGEKNKILEDTIKALKRQISALKQAGVEAEEKTKMLEETVSSLKNQLIALKEIDLGIEEKKR